MVSPERPPAAPRPGGRDGEEEPLSRLGLVARSQDSGKEPCASGSRITVQAASSIHPMGQVLGMQVRVLLVGRRILAPGLCTCQESSGQQPSSRICTHVRAQ